MTAPAKRLEPIKSEEDNDGILRLVSWDGAPVHPEEVERAALCYNALAGLHIENGELRELLDFVRKLAVGAYPADDSNLHTLYQLYQEVTAPSREATP